LIEKYIQKNNTELISMFNLTFENRLIRQLNEDEANTSLSEEEMISEKNSEKINN
jgi:hypothetical protein